MCICIAGMAAGEEAQSIAVFAQLCEMIKQHEALQDDASGLPQLQNAQQHLGKLAEVMHKHGFPTPG